MRQKINLSTYNAILNGSLKPWCNYDLKNLYFEHEINRLPNIESKISTQYEVNFIKTYDPKRKYYRKLIINQSNKFLNDLEIEISKNTEIEKTFTVKSILSSVLASHLRQTNDLIKIKGFFLEFILNKQKEFLQTDDLSAAFIIQSLKYHLIKIFYEVQIRYQSYLQDDFLDLHEINECFFNDTLQLEYFVKNSSLQSFESVKEIEGIKETIKQEATSSNEESFSYIYFDLKNDNLNDLCDNLKKNNFISNDTKLTDFKKVFSGKKSQNQIYWIGNQSELSYFVKLIHNDKKLVKNLKQRQWEVTLKCFVQKNGIPFDRDKLRTAQKPKRTAHLLEQSVTLLQ